MCEVSHKGTYSVWLTFMKYLWYAIHRDTKQISSGQVLGRRRKWGCLLMALRFVWGWSNSLKLISSDESTSQNMLNSMKMYFKGANFIISDAYIMLFWESNLAYKTQTQVTEINRVKSSSLPLLMEGMVVCQGRQKTLVRWSVELSKGEEQAIKYRTFFYRCYHAPWWLTSILPWH